MSLYEKLAVDATRFHVATDAGANSRVRKTIRIPDGQPN